MTELLQNIVDGLGRGSIYALLALGIAVIFGVMHLVNFAHGELITVSAYVAFAMITRGYSWWLVAVVVFLTASLVSVLIEQVAFRWVRGAPDFTMLLTSFGVHFLVRAIFIMYLGAAAKTYAGPGWIFDTLSVGGIILEVTDLVTIAATIVTLAATVWLLQKTMFGISLRAAAEDFDAARLMGVKSDRVIRGAFLLSGALAGVAAIFWLMKAGKATPSTGLSPMLKGVLAALIGGLGSMSGAVIGGLTLGLVEVMLRAYLPNSINSLVEAVVFLMIALLFIFRPQGLVSVSHAERV